MRTQNLEDQFWRYHRANPEVYRAFEKYALQMKQMGFKTYSARTIIHLIRWHSDLQTSDPDVLGFKISNNHSARYAVLLMAKRPEFVGFFDSRGVDLDIPASELPAPVHASTQGSFSFGQGVS